jgi:predicted nucleotidyltransferase
VYNPAVQHLPDELLQQIVQRLVTALHPLEIHLFGSHATGNTHRHSDVDLMVVVADGAPDSFELAQVGYPALAGLLAPVEMHFIRKQDLTKWASVKFSLPNEAIRKGKLIYAAELASRPAVA